MLFSPYSLFRLSWHPFALNKDLSLPCALLPECKEHFRVTSFSVWHSSRKCSSLGASGSHIYDAGAVPEGECTAVHFHISRNSTYILRQILRYKAEDKHPRNSSWNQEPIMEYNSPPTCTFRKPYNPPTQCAGAPRSANMEMQLIPIFIAVMGVTGSSKSYFIKRTTGADVQIGHDQVSCLLEFPSTWTGISWLRPKAPTK